MHSASRNNRIAVVDLLLESNATVDLIYFKKQTALHLAIEAGHLECVSLLVQKGANITLITQNGLSPLHLAIKLERTEIAKIIIKCANNKNGQSNISSEEEPERTMEAECILNEVSMEGNSSLHVAAMTGNIEIIKILSESGADVNQTNYFECSTFL